MRKLAVTMCGLLALAGCGRSEPEPPPSSSRDMASAEYAPALPGIVAAPSARAGDGAPDIAVTAAPGVAFNYRYAFRLPAARVGAVQERHAQACEALGVVRCRITGMLYRVVSDGDVQGMLAFKLDPALARRFGKAGVAAVLAAEGQLVESEITGEDVGTAIDAANTSERDLASEVARLERQLAALPPRAPERVDLAQRIQQLRDTIRTNAAGRTANRAALASTPVVFNYGSGNLVPGLQDRSPLGLALDRTGANILASLGAMIVILGTLLPWAAAGFGLFLLFRIARRRFLRPPEQG